MKFSRNVGNGPTNERLRKFWGTGPRIWIRIRIVTLVRRALEEVCTVPVLLVNVALAAYSVNKASTNIGSSRDHNTLYTKVVLPSQKISVDH